jgi:hypothetical protein
MGRDLYEKHAVATWNLGTSSAFAKKGTERKRLVSTGIRREAENIVKE